MRNLRATPHRITGETANYMMLGRKFDYPLTFITQLLSQSTQKESMLPIYKSRYKWRPKYVEPYTITKILHFLTYEMKRQGQKSVQHEGWIKLLVGDVVSDRQSAPPQEVSQDPPDTATIDTQSEEDYYDAFIVPPALLMPDPEPVPLTISVMERKTPPGTKHLR
ncbi:hypothetical protein EB796_004795 [Bugula neritina]|uniref:Uncharacterized protein n=1 Tax=Bugula neritina TaxID=10212 RepID=A0A7J7KGX0_BUGNE|nr:hypothetical protein EB796_004795 [Bugula neritina]